MGAQKIILDFKLLNAKSRYEAFKEQLEGWVGVLCTKHDCLDATVYVQDCGTHGFRAIKFYNDGLDIRVGSFQESQKLALQESINLL
jgi:hypothetical protein